MLRQVHIGVGFNQTFKNIMNIPFEIGVYNANLDAIVGLSNTTAV